MSSACVPLRPPVLAPIVTSHHSSSSVRPSSSFTTGQGSYASSSSTSTRPCRDSSCSGSSDWSWSTGLVTPCGDEKTGNEFLVEGTEYLNLSTKETWWKSTPLTPSSIKSQPKRTLRVDDSPNLTSSGLGLPLAESPTLSPQQEHAASTLAEMPLLSSTSVIRVEMPLDDSPTLPSTSRLDLNDISPLQLDVTRYCGTMSWKQRGKMPMRCEDDTRESKDAYRMAKGGQIVNSGRSRANDPFDLVALLSSAGDDACVSIPHSAPTSDSIFFDVHPSRPLASFPSSSSLASSLKSESGKPRIPTRTSSRSKPTPPVRGSSLRSLSKASISTSTSSSPSSSSSSTVTLALSYTQGSHRPAPVRNLSHPPPSNLTQHRAASLKLKKRLSPTLLQPISETPKDLDLAPDGNWALRKPYRTLGKSRSTPNLRSENTRDMTLKFKLRRSNSQSAGAGQNADAAFVSFPSSRTDSDIGCGEREGRASFSDIARSFIPRPVPTVPDRPPVPSRKSPRQSTLSSKGRTSSARRPSLLGLPEWSPKPSTTRSVSDSAVGINLSHLPAYALPNSRAATLSRGRSTPSVSLDLPRLTMSGSPGTLAKTFEDIFTPSLSESTPSSSHTSSFTVSEPSRGAAQETDQEGADREEALLAMMEAEKWDWPSPPFRITTTHTTPGLSTSETLDSLVTPLTPSEAGSDAGGSDGECWIHGEAEWIERSAVRNRGNVKKQGAFGSRDDEMPKPWRPLSLGSGSINSLDIAL
ncbi:hypothetical protein I316_02626 [Kwoniella heveanensis BCC8398]|uniref:Uncharacterized protein n=1 Tax=Kwoniella heveanensis BCC8398 TaxID=1296120 RepID=A0A1B9GX32_9TREE|nr:hypothetical protein I316_02626 [Kwoniella heveanensis BCC8398]